MNTVKAILGLTLLGAAGASQAGFVITDNVSPDDTSIGIVISNDFKDTLAQPALNITTYTLSGSLGVNEAGYVSYYYYGKEAGYRNEFIAGGLAAYSSGFTPSSQSYFNDPKYIGTVEVGTGLLDFRFCADNGGGSGSAGCVTNLENDSLQMLSFQSIAMNVTDGTAWLFWDDSGAGPDDNHDDMLIKAVFTPRALVPEPATLALLSLGLLGVGFGMRRKHSA